MKMIPLTRGQHAIVDEEDYANLIGWNWYAEKSENTYYAVRTFHIDGKKVNMRMHRVVNNTPDGLFTDHINGNGIDNRKCNLRAVTHQDNMINCARWKAGSSKYRGVSWHKHSKKWYAQITVDYKNLYIGAFATEYDAHIAYEAKRIEVRPGHVIQRGV